MSNLQFQPITLAKVTSQGKTGVIQFQGRPLGRSVDKPGKSDNYKKSVEIYLTDEDSFIIYVCYYDKYGEFALSDCVETDNLDLDTIRNSLKEEGIYPGPMYSRAVYHSYDRLKPLE
ncbi:hypothetical protein KGY79_13035 [Candidatus Bipolaricaulota bacterium]|nr:hypothetical protein [Candidatus Bipolaricaulota bacterium]